MIKYNGITRRFFNEDGEDLLLIGGRINVFFVKENDEKPFGIKAYNSVSFLTNKASTKGLLLILLESGAELGDRFTPAATFEFRGRECDFFFFEEVESKEYTKS